MPETLMDNFCFSVMAFCILFFVIGLVMMKKL